MLCTKLEGSSTVSSVLPSSIGHNLLLLGMTVDPLLLGMVAGQLLLGTMGGLLLLVVLIGVLTVATDKKDYHANDYGEESEKCYEDTHH